MFFIIGWVLCAVFVIAALVLYMDRLELQDQLKYARERSENWEKEAKALGWKSDFEKITDSLNNSVDQLNKTVEVMKRTCALQKETTAKWKKLAETCKEVSARMRAQNESLALARQKLEGLGRPRSADPKPEVPPAAVAPRTVSDGDVLAGDIGWDIPPKLPN